MSIVNNFIRLSIDLLPFIRYTIRIESERNKIMKRIMMKLLGAKFLLNGTHYWSLGTAMDEANKSGLKEIVWVIGWSSSYYQKAYVAKSHSGYVHADAANGQGW